MQNAFLTKKTGAVIELFAHCAFKPLNHFINSIFNYVHVCSFLITGVFLWSLCETFAAAKLKIYNYIYRQLYIVLNYLLSIKLTL